MFLYILVTFCVFAILAAIAAASLLIDRDADKNDAGKG